MTKQTINRIALAAVLVIASISAWADRVKVDALTNGTITVGAVAENGEQTVTLTVTPTNSYYIETSDIIVNKTQANAQAPQRRTPGYAEQLTVTAVSVDATGKGTYQFTVPDGYGAYVQATFHACMQIDPKVDITGWTYGAAANAPSVTGNSGQGSVTYTYASRGSDAFSSDVPVNAGDYTVKAVIAAAGHYLSGEATADFTIAKAAGTISYAIVTISKTYGDEAFVHVLTNTGDGAVTYATNKPEVATINATTGEVTTMSAGEATITATVTDGDNYSYATTMATYTLTVQQKTVGLAWGETTFDADGTEKQPAATATGLVADDVCSVTVTGAQTAVGSYIATATALSNANYMLPEDVTCDFTIVRDMSTVFTDGCQWATYVAQENLAMPDGLVAYVVSSVTKVDVTANKVDYIPVGVGILLYRDAATNAVYKGVAYAGEPDGEPTSVLKGNATAASEVVAGSDYVFYNDEFVLADNTATVGAGQAYLPAKDIAAGAASPLSINSTGIPTGIHEVGVSSGDSTWYTLDGLKFSDNPARRGLYIQNRKKIIVR